ncbi:MAG: hypothetical protein ACI8RZ_002321 [Myxococcota bacterium]|jgi:hypothetical protein
MLSILLACQTPVPIDSGPAGDEAPSITLLPLNEVALLRRMSLDLRGVSPSLEELDALESGTPLEMLVADYLADPRLEDTLTERIAERWLTRTDSFNLTTGSYGLDADQEFTFERAIGEEAPRLAARLIAEDAPWSALVTVDYTVVNEILEGLWPVEVLEDGDGWRRARYTDQRPPIGVLATNGMWLRYSTSNANLSRHRAAAISRLMLCSDYLSRPITFSSAGLIETGDLEDLLHNEQTCISCHATLDPLASALFGFWMYDNYDDYELSHYHPEREQLGAYFLGVEPAWFGQTIDDIDDLGGIIAADPRFSSCAVQTMAELLWQRPVALSDFEALDTLEADFRDSGMSSKGLLAAVLETPEYRVGDVTGDETLSEAVATRRLLSSSQLVTAVADLTGFVWEWEGFSQLENDDIGYRILVGGLDGDTVTSRQETPTITSLLVIRRLAQAAASAAVEHDLLDAEAPALLTQVDLDTRPDDTAFSAQLTELYRRLYATTPSDDDRLADAALWEAVEAADGSDAAWRSLLATLLRDPAFWTY